MSYILDALKKADSERKLGAIPGVHSLPAAPASSLHGKSSWFRLGVALAILVSLLALAWLLLARPWQRQEITILAQAPAPATVPAAENTAPPRSGGGFSIDPTPLPLPPVEPAVAAKTPAPAPSRPAAAKPTAPVKPTAQSAPVKPASQPAPAAAAAPSQGSQAAKPVPQADARVPTLRELPEGLRREIPALTISGYLYASNPADRSIVINNMLLREGGQVAPGLTLERISANDATLNYRGQRYRMRY